MQRADYTFHLIDLESQAEAVQALLVGRSLDEKIAWFDEHGKLSPLPGTFAGAQAYELETVVGCKCAFFIKDDRLVFIGDNTCWSVPRPTSALHSSPEQRTGVAGLVSFVRKLLARGSSR